MTTQTDQFLHATAANFDAEVLGSDVPVLVDFYADWCGPCRALKPNVESLAADYRGRVKFAFVNIDDHPELAQRFDILSIPALRLFKGGGVVASANGALPRDQLVDLVDRAL